MRGFISPGFGRSNILRILFSRVSCKKGFRRILVGHQFKLPEQINSLQTILDGKHLFCQETGVFMVTLELQDISFMYRPARTIRDFSDLQSSWRTVQNFGSSKPFFLVSWQHQGLSLRSWPRSLPIFEFKRSNLFHTWAIFWSLPERKRALFRICSGSYKSFRNWGGGSIIRSLA